MNVHETRRRLFQHLRSKRLHPALLLVGESTAEILETAKDMAKQLLCKRPTPEGYCDHCTNCQRIAKEIHPDVRLIRKEEEDILKIESIRELCHEMEIAPLEGGAKVCIVEACERLNAASANAFLKTLEEPVENRFFWLITSQPGAILPTVLSRCLQFTFPPDACSTSDDETFRKGLEECLKRRVTEPIVTLVSEKTDCLAFLQFLQRELRESLVRSSNLFPGLDPYLALDYFEESVSLEGRLRSNANYGLLLDSYLRSTVLKTL